MRSIAIFLLVFALGAFVGGEFWPESHDDLNHHFRFHRGRLPHSPAAAEPSHTPVRQGRGYLPSAPP